MEVIEIHPVTESSSYVCALEERDLHLGDLVEGYQAREREIEEKSCLLDQQRERLTRLLEEADVMLAEQIVQCLTGEERVLTWKELLDQEDYLVGVQLAQEEAQEGIRGLLVEQ